MSRPMALGLILLVLFLTSQSDWKPSKEDQSETEARGGKADLHREEIKEKIIVDLTAHNKRLEAENLKLRKMVSNVHNILRDCQCELPLNTTSALLEGDLEASVNKKEATSASKTEEEDMQLLGASSLTESLKSRLEPTVRMGHALAGRVQGDDDNVLGAKDKTDVVMLPVKQELGVGEAKSQQRQAEAMSREAQSQGASTEDR